MFCSCKVTSQQICIFGTDLVRLEVEEEGHLFQCQMFVHPSKKKKKSKLAQPYHENQWLPQIHKGSVGLLSDDFVRAKPAPNQAAAVLLLQCRHIRSKRLAGLTPAIAALGFGVALEKWLFSCLALVGCSQPVTLKVDTAQRCTHERMDNRPEKWSFPMR